MEKYFLDRDIKVFCVLAESFLAGILEAHRKLHSLLPSDKMRNFFGISNVSIERVIIYKASVVELYEGESQKYGCGTFIIRKGEYISMYLTDFRSDVQNVGKVFEQLLSTPNIDPNGACIEVYVNNIDMRCMVRLDSPSTYYEQKG